MKKEEFVAIPVARQYFLFTIQPTTAQNISQNRQAKRQKIY